MSQREHQQLDGIHCRPAAHSVHVGTVDAGAGEEERLGGHGAAESGCGWTKSPGRCLPELRCAGARQQGQPERELSAKASQDAFPAELHSHARAELDLSHEPGQAASSLRGHQAVRRQCAPRGALHGRRRVRRRSGG